MKESDISKYRYRHHGLDKESFKKSVVNLMVYSMGKDHITSTHRDWFHTAAAAVRARLIERWMDTMRSYYAADAKRIYYLSLEFLTGRLFVNSLLNLEFYDACRDALAELELDIDRIKELESDAALGNGGLGRLAACFLDSLATLNLPGYGYGIRYEYGMFTQRIENGWQVEHPDNWLRYGNPWEFARPEVLYSVKFGGRVVEYKDELGHLHHHWVDTDDIMAMAFDTPVPGFGMDTVNNMRLWSAKASRDFNLKYFNEGNYIQAVIKKLGGGVRLALAQYRELAAFAQFASDLDEATRKQLERGRLVMELMKQTQFSPMSVAEMAVTLFAINKGYFDGIPVNKILAFEAALQANMKSRHKDLLDAIETSKDLSADNEKLLSAAIESFKSTAVY